MNVLSGQYRPDEGEISVAGSAVHFRSPRDALRSGIGMLHQHFMLVEREPVPLGDPVLELRNCSGDDARGHRAFRRVSFAVRRGEVFSIVGVAGNGQRELVLAVTGASRFASGQVLSRLEREHVGQPGLDRHRHGK